MKRVIMIKHAIALLTFFLLSGCSVSWGTSIQLYSPTNQSTQIEIPSAKVPAVLETSSKTPELIIAETPKPTATLIPTIFSPSFAPTKTSLLLNPAVPEGDYFLVNTSLKKFDVRAMHNSFLEEFLIVTENIRFGKTLSSDASLFAYASGDAYDQSKIMVINSVDNSLRETMKGGRCVFPSFAPDGQHFVAVCFDDSSPQLVLIDLLDGTKTNIIPYSLIGNETTLAWSPDGKYLAFVAFSSNSIGSDSADPLYLVDTQCFKDPLTCQNQIRLLTKADHFFYNHSIVWSPDSQNILICDGHKELKVINVVSGTKIVKVIARENISGYAWSPDNQSLAFTEYWFAEDIESGKIVVIPVNGEKQISLPIEIKEGNKNDFTLYDWVKILDFKLGGRYTVNTLAKNLILREKPSLESKQIKKLQPGDSIIFVGGPMNADYYTWWKMKVGDTEGWAQGIKYWFDAVK